MNLMADTRTAPYGSWKSPITSELIVTRSVGLGQIALDGEDIYWAELRPEEGGRYVLVRYTPGGKKEDITPPPFNVRTRVHEYGGGAFAVHKGVVFFSNFMDQRLYCQDPGKYPRPITPEGALRYADGVIDGRRGAMICVCEDHADDTSEAVNTLVRIHLDGCADPEVLVSGNDFYSSPRLSRDGSRLAWLTWDHPNLPWDGTELWVAVLNADGSLGQAEQIAGGMDESIFQPEWSLDGTLYFVSDRTGWWNLYRWRDGRIERVVEMEAEFGEPQWVFGLSTYAFETADRMVCSYTQRGCWHLASLDLRTGILQAIQTPYTDLGFINAAQGQVVFLGGSPTDPASVVRIDLQTKLRDVLRRSSDVTIDPGYISYPQAIEYPTENGQTAHAFFYPPQNKDYKPPAGERPPLLVMSHGGPTAASSSTFNLRIQYWTSRGIAVVDVNYGGSTGYGKAYRQRLEGQWGVVDVDDCVNAAKYLAQRSGVDGERLAIRGGSAGGYTTLCALAFRDVFRAGASYYGVSDLEALLNETHKFESRYERRLIGPYPERIDLYQGRSPIHFAEHLSSPVIFFQGLEDKIVPPNQAEVMIEALRDRGIPEAFVSFEGEQHGFRRAENIKRSLEAELFFYSRIFSFPLADPVEPVPIDNL
jgi:dipeptidyl aminopeptidase/acylaminoacyl peptidase